MAVWRLKDGHTHKLPNGKTMQAGEIVSMAEHRMQAFLDRFERVDTPPPPEEMRKVASARLILQHRGGGWWDVVNQATGKPVNKKGLRKEEAERMADG